MKKDADFVFAGQKLSIHTTDDQLAAVVSQEVQKQGLPEEKKEELLKGAMHTRDVAYNATASVKTDRW